MSDVLRRLYYGREAHNHPEHASNKQGFIAMQVIALAYVGVCFLLWGIVEHFWPDFFSPFEWSQGNNGLEHSLIASLCFWPVYIWGAVLATLSCLNLVPARTTGTTDEGHAFYDTITSTLAGIWEELGYRCVFILGAMISIMFANWFWGWLLVIFVIIAIVGGLAMMAKSEGNPIVIGIAALFIVFCFFLMYWTWNLEDPVYWLYLNVVFPILSFISFGALDPILNFQPEHAPALFIMGAISANAKFRDGHKYQGIIGYFNSWIAGFVLLYAMLYYGLLTAIIVHAIYDIEFAVVRYIGRKVDNLQEG